MSTNYTSSPTRTTICQLVAEEKDFTLRMPSAGMVVKPNYNFCDSTLEPRDIVGVSFHVNQSWFEIGMIDSVRWDMMDGFMYTISKIPRLTDEGDYGLIEYPANRIACKFKVINA